MLYFIKQTIVLIVGRNWIGGMKLKIKKCTVCGTMFESHYGMEVCSDACKIERKRQYDRKGNQKRYSGKSNELEDITCKRCGNVFSGLNRRYCKECSEIARTEMKKSVCKEWYIKNRKEQKER